MAAAGVILVVVVVAVVLVIVAAAVVVVHRVLQPTDVRIDVAVVGLFCSITNESCVNTLLILHELITQIQYYRK